MSGTAGLGKSSYDSAPLGENKAHNPLDRKDARSHPQTAEAALHDQKKQAEAEEEMKSRNPTDLAKEHGNKPSRGAEIDEELKKEDELRLQEKSGN
ncbi:hypothetical protein CALVIDRAFT_568423 [Calocera viscosa TUFC12733]|uniref:Uncharacterized protein n=1 Tax=Calocera viscosa (strain TUFC12733) TaxID=1330018 RepID=A0A167H5U2_CALVF|nr:hypothetical protein CALVIDRAFT_568423 [Calocera viscosa TUFC12733]